METRENSKSTTIETVIRILRERRILVPDKQLIIGVTGHVASGKSRFSRDLRYAIEEVLNSKVIYCPFDYWINADSLNAPIYADRFYLQELKSTLQSIKSGDQWMCPRYDLMKRGYVSNATRPLAFNSLEVVWGGRRFVKLSSAHDIPDIEGGKGVYFEPETARFFSLFLPERNTVYFMDGTLVCHESVVGHFSYDAKVFVSSSWVNRVARMIRRFNRREVFGDTASTEMEYVGFLVREAKACADREIADQIDEEMLLYKSNAETISNILDLYYLKQGLNNQKEYAARYFLMPEDVNVAIDEALRALSSIAEVAKLQSLRTELGNLIESKHLLLMQDADQIFKRLAELLHYSA